MKVRWTAIAAGDLKSVHEYVNQESLTRADAVVGRILAAVDILERYPQIGRQGRIEGTRELVVTGLPFIVAYRLRRDQVEILSVLHTARKWPSTF